MQKRTTAEAAGRIAVADDAGDRSALLPLWKRGFERWRRAAHAIGVVQTRIIMFFMYLLMVLPIGLVFRLRSDPLQLRAPGGTNWTPAPDEEQTLERARQQF